MSALLGTVTGVLDSSGPQVSADDFTVSLPGTTQAASAVGSAGTCTAGWRTQADGDVQIAEDTNGGVVSYSNDHTWCTPSSYEGETPGQYFEVKATLNSGSLESGTTGTWLAMSSSRTWRVQDAGIGGPYSANLTIAIRRADTQVQQDSQTYTLYAEKTES